MSSEAIAWAFKVNLKPSALKFTLVALCECANYKTGHIHPSIAHLEEITGQDRKTLIANIAKLELLGLIVDTGERAGKTGQIKVYRATTETAPKTEQFQKRNSSEFPAKQSQKRDTEPSREPSVDKAKALPTKRAREKSEFVLPDWIPADAWAGFEEMRRSIRKPMTDRARAMIVTELQKLRGPPGAILDQSTRNNWQDVYELKDKGNGQREQANGMGRTERAALRAAQDLGLIDSRSQGRSMPAVGGHAVARQEPYALLSGRNE